MNEKIISAIYARYSSELQKEDSVEEQKRRLRELAKEKGWQALDESSSDVKISGKRPKKS